MATGDAMRVALVGTLDGELFETTFGLVEGSGGADPNPLANCAAAVAAALGATPFTGFSDALSISSIQVTDIQPGLRGQYVLGYATAGDDPGGALPSQCALVVSWHTDFKGPANRGRMFLGGAPKSTTDGDFYTSDILDPASAFASRIFDAFGPSDGTTYQLNVLSYVPGSSPRALRAAVPITSFSIDNTVKTMRRRGQGVHIHRRSA